MSDETTNQSNDISTSLLTQGLSFLLNPNTSKYTLEQKLSYLEKKGLKTSDILELIKLSSNLSKPELKLKGKYDWLWTLLSLTVSIGAGFAIYAMTNEDDNYFPKDDNIIDDNDVIQNEYIEIDNIKSNNSKSIDDKLDDILIKLDSKSDIDIEPNWSKELKDLLTVLIKEIKSRKIDEESSVESSHHNDLDQPAEKTIDERLDNFLQSLSSALYENNKFKYNNDIIIKFCSTLSLYLVNIRDQPNMPRYRKISSINTTFKSNITIIKECDSILKSLGFSFKNNIYEWIQNDNGFNYKLFISNCVNILNEIKKCDIIDFNSQRIKTGVILNDESRKENSVVINKVDDVISFDNVLQSVNQSNSKKLDESHDLL